MREHEDADMCSSSLNCVLAMNLSMHHAIRIRSIHMRALESIKLLAFSFQTSTVKRSVVNSNQNNYSNYTSRQSPGSNDGKNHRLKPNSYINVSCHEMNRWEAEAEALNYNMHLTPSHLIECIPNVMIVMMRKKRICLFILLGDRCAG